MHNPTAEPVTLKRITLSSVGSGPARIGTTLRVRQADPAAGFRVRRVLGATAFINDYTPDYRPPLALRVRPTIRDAAGSDETSTASR